MFDGYVLGVWKVAGVSGGYRRLGRAHPPVDGAGNAVRDIVLPAPEGVVGPGLFQFVADAIIYPVHGVAATIAVGGNRIVHPDFAIARIVTKNSDVPAWVTSPGKIAHWIVTKPSPRFIGGGQRLHLITFAEVFVVAKDHVLARGRDRVFRAVSGVD